MFGLHAAVHKESILSFMDWGGDEICVAQVEENFNRLMVVGGTCICSFNLLYVQHLLCDQTRQWALFFPDCCLCLCTKWLLAVWVAHTGAIKAAKFTITQLVQLHVIQSENWTEWLRRSFGIRPLREGGRALKASSRIYGGSVRVYFSLLVFTWL